MPDYGADPSSVPEDKSWADDPTRNCPNCGAVLPREGSYGVNEESVGLVCPSCGTKIGEST